MARAMGPVWNTEIAVTFDPSNSSRYPSGIHVFHPRPLEGRGLGSEHEAMSEISALALPADAPVKSSTRS